MSSDDLAGAVDLAGGGTNDDAGYSVDEGMVGSACTSACDCTPGLGCIGGKCRAAPQPIYCCTGTPCPNGDICQHATGGGFGRCGASGVDLAGIDTCPFIDCSGNNGTARCMMAGCSMCALDTQGNMSCKK